MSDFDVTVKGVAVYSCRTREEEDATPDQVGVYEGDQLQEDPDGQEVHDIVKRMLEHDALKKKYGKRKNARVHQWKEPTGENAEQSDGPARNLLEEIRRGNNLETNSESLATRYIRQDRSVQDLLLIVRYQNDNRNFAAVLKTPYLDRAREIDVRSATITENDHVIQEETDKCLLYPYIDYGGDLDQERSRVFQENGASNYAQYWYRFVGLAEKEVPDEVVEERLAARAKQSDEDAAFSDYEEFKEESDELFEDQTHLQGEVQLSIGDQRQFRVSLRELKAQEDVILARNGSEIYVILSGATPQITTGSGDQKKSVFESLEGIRELSDVLSDLE